MIISLVIISVVLIVGIFIFLGGKSCPECPQASSWSKCNQDAIKTRTNYKCSEETNYQCQSYIEESQCKTELPIKGAKGLDVVITPTLDELVKGTIKININSVPSNVEKIWIMMGPQGQQPQAGEDPFKMPNTIIQIEDATAGKIIFIDTAKVSNGVYNLGVMATNNPNGAPWEDVIQTQIVVEN